MAYSDYGGYAYKNGELRKDFCDVTLYKERDPDPTKHYPLFFGENRDKVFPGMHVSLGDMEARLGLYKQSSFEFWLDGKELAPFEILSEQSKQEVPDYKATYTKDDGTPYLNTDAFMEAEKPAVFEFGEFKAEIFWEVTDNHYQYARLTQPDGSIWTGFSGYGVGSGLEDSEYHPFSTDSNIKRLKEIFPDNISQDTI